MPVTRGTRKKQKKSRDKILKAVRGQKKRSGPTVTKKRRGFTAPVKGRSKTK